MVDPRKKKGSEYQSACITGVISDPDLMSRPNDEITSYARWLSNFEVLLQSASGNAQLAALSGMRLPYPGALVFVQEGALADLPLVEGNPLENIDLIADPHNNFVAIMKDGNV